MEAAMTKRVLLAVVVLGLMTSHAVAQSGDGSLRGTVTDEQGAAMPGVSVTAISTALLMIEVSSPSNVLNIQGELQNTLPLVEGKYWSDFLHILEYTGQKPRQVTSH
jgi:hypothetical protein